jgi:hypothetical protein
VSCRSIVLVSRRWGWKKQLSIEGDGTEIQAAKIVVSAKLSLFKRQSTTKETSQPAEKEKVRRADFCP